MFSSSLEELWRSGIVVTSHAERLSGYDGVFLFKRGQACRISAPPSLVESLRRSLEALDVDEVFNRSTFVHLLGSRVDAIIGPNWYGYVDSLRFRSQPGGDCRRISECDASALMTLRASCGETEWAEAAFNLESPAMFGCFDQVGELVAASNLTGWRTATDLVGVVTRPRRRGRGYGAAVASMATAAALEDTAVVAWRARGTNTASIHIALRLGFEHYGENLAVRIR